MFAASSRVMIVTDTGVTARDYSRSGAEAEAGQSGVSRPGVQGIFWTRSN
jgi:hypothetical protein